MDNFFARCSENIFWVNKKKITMLIKLYYYNYYNHFTAVWILSRTTRVNWYHRKVNQFKFY